MIIKMARKVKRRAAGKWDNIAKELWNMIRADWDVDDWLDSTEITEEEQKEFPNAKKAAQLRKSKLYKALK